LAIHLEINRCVGLRERLSEGVDASDPLATNRGDHVAGPQAGIESRRARKDAQNDDLVWDPVVDDDAVVIQRIESDHGLLDCGRLEHERLLLTVAQDHDLNGLRADVRANQELHELGLGGYALAVDRDDDIAFAKSGVGKQALVFQVGNHKAFIAAGIDPQAEIGSTSGLNVLARLLAGFTSRFASFRSALASGAGFLAGFTGFFPTLAAGLAGRFAWSGGCWSDGGRRCWGRCGLVVFALAEQLCLNVWHQ
jgi:hypothetical protein